jgi:hypothetical protein
MTIVDDMTFTMTYMAKASVVVPYGQLLTQSSETTTQRELTFEVLHHKMLYEQTTPSTIPLYG